MIRVSVFLVAALLAACAVNPSDDGSQNLTVGTVQKEIRIGMPGAEVAEALGSPNVVSTDADRNEVWIYDKISSQVVETNASMGLLILRGFSKTVGLANASASQSSKSRSDRTLTVIIKFDDTNLVRDFAYHTSRF